MKKLILILCLIWLIGLLISLQRGENEIVSPLPSEPTPTATPTNRIVQVSLAKVSYYTEDYCRQYNPACKTASGDVFDDSLFTCACSYKYRLGSRLRFSYGGRSVVAKCNDRGSFEEKYGRVADLSKATFAELAPLSKGVIQVTVEELK